MSIFSDDKKHGSILEDAMVKLNKAADSVTGRKLRNAATAVAGSIDDGNLLSGDLWQNSDGRFDPGILRASVVRSLASSPQMERLYDQAADSQYGAIVDQLARGAKSTYAINKKTDVGSQILKGYKDRQDARQFTAAKGQTLSGMSQTVNELAAKQQKAINKTKGYAAVDKALQTELRIGRGRRKFDPDQLLEAADKEHYMSTGEHLTDDEKQYAWDALRKAHKRGFNKKALNIVYANRPGGLNASRYRAAQDTVSRHAAQTGQRAQMIGTALDQANQTLDRVLEMQGPDKRIHGPKVNIGRLMGTYKQLNEQDPVVKKGSADNPTLLNALSREDFETRPVGITRVTLRRNLDEEGGAGRYANALSHAWMQTDEDKDVLSLKTALHKYFRERSFDDDAMFDMTKDDDEVQG